MKPSICLMFLLTMLAACNKPAENQFSSEKVAGLTIGMDQAEIAKQMPDVHFQGTQGCQVAMSPTHRLRLMTEDGKLTRVYIQNPQYRTDKGIGVGSSEADAKKAYGDALKTEPNKYDEKAHNLVLIDSEGKGKGYIFETDGKAITTANIGRLPALRYVESCG